jgi:hypothetical protein
MKFFICAVVLAISSGITFAGEVKEKLRPGSILKITGINKAKFAGTMYFVEGQVYSSAKELDANNPWKANTCALDFKDVDNNDYGTEFKNLSITLDVDWVNDTPNMKNPEIKGEPLATIAAPKGHEYVRGMRCNTANNAGDITLDTIKKAMGAHLVIKKFGTKPPKEIEQVKEPTVNGVTI